MSNEKKKKVWNNAVLGFLILFLLFLVLLKALFLESDHWAWFSHVQSHIMTSYVTHGQMQWTSERNHQMVTSLTLTADFAHRKLLLGNWNAEEEIHFVKSRISWVFHCISTKMMTPVLTSFCSFCCWYLCILMQSENIKHLKYGRTEVTLYDFFRCEKIKQNMKAGFNQRWSYKLGK